MKSKNEVFMGLFGGLKPDRVVDLIAYNEIVPTVNQIEINPFYQRADKHELLKKHNILTQPKIRRTDYNQNI